MATTRRRIRRERHYSDPVSVRLRADQLPALEALVESRDRSLNALVRDAVDLLIDGQAVRR